MFENLTGQLTQAFKRIKGQGRLSEKNIQKTLKEIRKALIQADVALAVVDEFLEQTQQEALGQEVRQDLNPGQAFIKIVQKNLTDTLGGATQGLALTQQPPVVILLAGLQGAGKTTTAAKLGLLLKEQANQKVLLTSVDIHRPAAIEQLETLAEQQQIAFFKGDAGQDAPSLARLALDAAKKQVCDILIVDTAGRMHIDEALMEEVKAVHHAVNPAETLFVVDSMIGQEAAHTAKAFHQSLALTGIILTKTDGDARGGAALSTRFVTGQPIKFIGTGEKIDQIETFHPDRMASRILDMGDILTLIEQLDRKVDKSTSQKLIKKIKSGRQFDFNDFLTQIEQMQHVGGIGQLITQLPGAQQVSKDQLQGSEQQIKSFKAMIQSMTPKERSFPHIISSSRKKRITQGSGTSVPQLNQLLKQFTKAQKMMKKMPKMARMQDMMASLKGQN